MAKPHRLDLALSQGIGGVARRAAALAQRAVVAAGLPPGFDAASYLAMNPDVAASGMDAARHYLRFGRAELRRLLPDGGRIDHPQSRALTARERADWRGALALRAGREVGGIAAVLRDHPRAAWAYAGFTLGAYLVAHPDLAAQLDDPMEGAFHYLEFGLEEGGYLHSLQATPCVVAALYGGAGQGATGSLAALLAANHSPYDITLTEAELWARAGLPPTLADWFDPVHYHAMAGALADLGAPQPPAPDADAAQSRIRLLRHFLTCGIGWRGMDGQVMPIHRDLGFDTGLYRALSGGGDYRHFLRHGIAQGLAGDAAGMLSAVCDGPVGRETAGAIVAALPAYARAAGLAPEPAALVLSSLLNTPHPAGFAALASAITGPDAPVARAALARFACRASHPPDITSRLCWALIAAGGDDAPILARLASIATTQKRAEEAVALRARAMAARGFDPLADPWLTLSYTEDQITAGRVAEAAPALSALHPLARADLPLGRRRMALARLLFDRIWANLQAEVAAHGVAGVQARLRLALDALTPPQGPSPQRDRPIRHIALIGADDIPQCHRYRVDQKAHHLRLAGFTVSRFHLAELAGAFAAALPQIDAAIFCRLPAFPDVIAAISAARDHGVLSFYDIDDAVFDSSIFPPDPLSYMDKIGQHAHDAMACGTVLFEHCARLCDYALAPTEPLVDALQTRVTGGRAWLYPNALDPVLMAASITPQRPRAAVVTLFYGSNTLAHKSDFHSLLEPALAAILAQYGARVRVHLVGDFGAMTLLDPNDPRLRIDPPMADYETYLGHLAQADINLSVLAPSPLADSKSPIKWQEAAAFAIPSIVTRTIPHERVMTDGETGLIVDDSAGFITAMRRLIDAPDLAARIGLAARGEVVAKLSPEAMAHHARALFDGLVPPPAAAAARRKRLLIVNVFYPPQSYGGATRVVADTARAFRATHGAEWEVDVICTCHGGGQPLDVTVWSDHGIRVHAITAPAQEAGDMTASDPRMGAVFERLLDRIAPGIVHFHCVQRLTASVVAVTRGRGLPYVITLHDGWWLGDRQFLLAPDGGLETYDYSRPPRGRAGVLSPLLRDAARVVAVSAPFAALHHRAGLTQVGVLENASPALAVLPRLPSVKGRVRLGHLGGTAAIKGLPLLQSALMAGDFPRLELTVVDHARAHRPPVDLVWGRTPVRLIPPVPQDRMAWVYAGLDVLVAPSVWPESYGLVAREARAAGLWVIASDRGAMGADLCDGVDGFVVDVAQTGPLMAVLAQINADPARFLAPPPAAPAGRSLADQVAEIVAVYAAILAERG